MLSLGDVYAGPQTVAVTITVEEPVFLTLQAGKADEYEAEISDLRIELSDLRRQLEDSQAQLADNGGVLRTAQEQLAHTHDALSIERQMTMDLRREVTAISQAPLAGAGSSAADIGFDNVESVQQTSSRGWTDREGVSNGNRSKLANSTGHPGLDKAAAIAQVRPLLCSRVSATLHCPQYCFFTAVSCLVCQACCLLYKHLMSVIQTHNTFGVNIGW